MLRRAALAVTTPGLAGDPQVTIRAYGRTFDLDHRTHLSVRLDYETEAFARLCVHGEEWRRALLI